VTAVIFLIIAWLSTSPGSQREELAGLSPQAARFADAEGFTEVADTVVGRCSMCHAAEVFWPGLHAAPKGVVLETRAQIAAHAREIYLQAGRSHAMPPGNVTGMEPAERRRIIEWYQRATAG
jgi:uncharacterized membrane protein